MSSNKNYQELLKKIKSLGEQQHLQYNQQIRCRSGCHQCCHPPDSLFQIEADALSQGISSLSVEQKVKISERLDVYEKDSTRLCPLLEDERCQVYDSRPSICRTQGYALWLRDVEDREKGELSWCELNFTEETPTLDEAFDVERLNTMLSLLTQINYPNQPPRRRLVSIIRQALSA